MAFPGDPLHTCPSSTSYTGTPRASHSTLPTFLGSVPHPARVPGPCPVHCTSWGRHLWRPQPGQPPVFVLATPPAPPVCPPCFPSAWPPRSSLGVGLLQSPSPASLSNHTPPWKSPRPGDLGASLLLAGSPCVKGPTAHPQASSARGSPLRLLPLLFYPIHPGRRTLLFGSRISCLLGLLSSGRPCGGPPDIFLH